MKKNENHLHNNRMHAAKICNAAFYHLHNIRRTKYLSRNSLLTFIPAFITSRLDYCNGLSYGLPKSQIIKLQYVQNATARLVLHLRTSKQNPFIIRKQMGYDQSAYKWKGRVEQSAIRSCRTSRFSFWASNILFSLA